MRPAIEERVVGVAQREGIPVAAVTPCDRVSHGVVDINPLLNFSLGILIVGDEFGERDQLAEIILDLVGPLHPDGPVATDILALVNPVRLQG